MPKQKTHSGLKKRLRRTGSGKLSRGKAFGNHNAAHKTTKQNRNLRKEVSVHPSDEKRIKSLVSNLK